MTVPSTEEGAAYFVGEKAELLSIFSVNLRGTLDLAPKSETEADAKVLTEALEFFVFGRAKNVAARNSGYQGGNTQRRQASNAFEQRLMEEIARLKKKTRARQRSMSARILRDSPDTCLAGKSAGIWPVPPDLMVR